MGRARPKAPTTEIVQLAKKSVAHRYKVQPSGKLRVALTLYLDRELEQLTARAIAETRKIEGLVREILEGAGQAARHGSTSTRRPSDPPRDHCQ